MIPGRAPCAPGRARLQVGATILAAFLCQALPGLIRADDPPAPAKPAEPELIQLEPVTVPDAAEGTEPAGEGRQGTSVPAPAQGIDAREILSGLWFKYQALRQRGSEREAATLIDAAIGFMQREGLQSAPEIAAAFLAEGRRDLRNGDGPRALEAYRLASRFDPALPAARFGEGSILLFRQHNVTEAIKAWWAGLKTLLGQPESLFYLSGNALLILYLGVCWGSAAALVLLALKWSPALFHDLRERTRGVGARAAAPLLGGVILFAPLLLPIPFPWVLAFWGAIFFAYVRGAERVVVLAVLAVLILAGPFGRALSWHFETATDPTARALLQSARSGADLRHEAALRQVTRDHPEDPVYMFLLASAYRIGGHFDEAMTLYQQILKDDPANARAMINLGNLHALRQEFAQAQDLYQQAAQLDPKLALAHYDSHLAHLETFNMEAADEELRRARAVDDALVTQLLLQAGEGGAKRSPQDSLYPSGEIWKHALRLRLTRGPMAEGIRSLTNPTSLAAGAAFLAVLLLPGLAISPRSGAARLCRRCGRAFCRRCQVITKFPHNCSPCVHLFILKDGLAPQVRDKKKEDVVRYRRRQFVLTRGASLILPGCGHVLQGRSILGALLLCGWATTWVGLILRGRLPVPPGGSQTAAVTGGLIFLLAIGLISWLVANLSRQEPQETQE